MKQTELGRKLLKLTELRYRLVPTLIKHTSDNDNDNMLGFVLKCHLFTEQLLEEIIRFKFEADADAILSANLNYIQKLEVANNLYLSSDYKLLQGEVVGSLRKLNSLRNKVAHRAGTTVSEADIKELFLGLEGTLPYGDIFEHGKKIAILQRYAGFIFGNMFPKVEPIEEDT